MFSLVLEEKKRTKKTMHNKESVGWTVYPINYVFYNTIPLSSQLVSHSKFFILDQMYLVIKPQLFPHLLQYINCEAFEFLCFICWGFSFYHHKRWGLCEKDSIMWDTERQSREFILQL